MNESVQFWAWLQASVVGHPVACAPVVEVPGVAHQVAHGTKGASHQEVVVLLPQVPVFGSRCCHKWGSQTLLLCLRRSGSQCQCQLLHSEQMGGGLTETLMGKHSEAVGR